ncbi:hypothetical protein FHX64_002045 [Microbacter margulisiae]|uniref:Uncharacterized protein n=1 Tax=Microbacter margulisiae TaxID=1350067 RepID=A0A7W5H2X9_9PORP|nr:hypothetical protein [Microbacter margulisiae]
MKQVYISVHLRYRMINTYMNKIPIAITGHKKPVPEQRIALVDTYSLNVKIKISA